VTNITGDDLERIGLKTGDMAEVTVKKAP